MINTSDFERRIADLQHQCADCIADISKKEREVAVLNAHIADLHFQLIRSDMIGPLARKLLTEIDKKIMLKLTRDGQKKRKVRRLYLNLKLRGDESYRELIDAARLYDVQSFFVYKSKHLGSPLRLHYRVVAKLYRVCRDGSLSVARVIRRFV